MASLSSELAILRALTFRISSTNTAQLPQHVPAIAAALANCRNLLSSTQSSNSKAASTSEASVALHKYRTLLTTLLQDRTPQGRWAAVILIKATIEAGGWETLQKALPWVRGLLGILTKPDPPSLKKLCIITLTRIFILTREYPTLVREITTPSLPTLVQTCLQLATGKHSHNLLQVILECFNELLPRHPTIFRSYLKQLQPFLARLIAPTPSSKLGAEQIPGGKLDVTSSTVAAAQQLYAQLSCCAPKGTSSEEWQKSLKEVISAAHQVADKLFRAVHEEWQSSTRDPLSASKVTLEDDVEDLESGSQGLPPWSGIFGGNERLLGLLHLTQQFLETPTAGPVYLNLAAVLDLCSRLLALTVPSGKPSHSSVKLNNQVSKEERDSLWLVLPDIHNATIDVLLSLAARTESSTLGLDPLVLDQLTWLFGSESSLVQVRTVCYTAIASLLQRSGPALPKSLIDSLGPLMRNCCEDLLSLETMSPAGKEKGPMQVNGTVKSNTTANADTFLNSAKLASDPTSSLVGLKTSAQNLLSTLLANIKAQHLSDSMRARLDRTAILTQQKDAMLRSVLNPPPSKRFGKPAASILPLLARSFASESDVEGLIRPRMPVIRMGTQDTENVDDEEQDEDELIDEEMEDEESEIHAGHELEAILEAAGGTLETADENHVAAAVEAEASLEPKVTVPITSDVKTPVPEPEEALSIESAKRPHTEDLPPSPSKRVKSMEVEQRTVRSIPPAAPVPSRVTRSSVGAPATSDFTVTSTASVVPELPTPGDAAAEEDDSDADDVIPLVLGQDTDDESDQ